MNLIIIEINDFELTVHDHKSSEQYNAYAFIEKGSVTFGDQALSNIKLSPDDFYSHYWQRLGFEEINSKNDNIKHYADLAYKQLIDITAKYPNDIKVIFITPAYYKEQQLALLLGLAESCNLNTLALINQDIINIENVAFLGKYRVAHMGLHHCNLANIAIKEDIKLNQNEIFNELGLLELVSYISNWCNQSFIKHSRFDAFHSADTEQALFDQVYKMLFQIINTGVLTDNDISLNEKSISVKKVDLQDKIACFFRALFEINDKNSLLHLTPALYNLISNTHFKDQCERITKPTFVDFIQNRLPFIEQQKGICLLDTLPILKQYQNNELKSNNAATHIVFSHYCVAFKDKPIYLNDCVDIKFSHPFSTQQTPESYAALISDGKKINLTLLKTCDVSVNGECIKHNTTLNSADSISNQKDQDFKLITVIEEF